MKHTPSHTDDSALRSAAASDARQALSAAIDGELPVQELRFFLRALDHDAGLQQSWVRYERMRDALRGSLPASRASAGFAARISAALTADPAASSPRRRHWLRWSAGGAIAASVAAATLMIGQPTGDADRVVAAQGTDTNVNSVADTDAGHTWAMPSAVPPWLSGNSASLLSQRASATLTSPLRGSAALGATSAGYPPLYRYRTLDNADGSYLLLLDPAQAASTDASPQRVIAGGR